MERAGITTGKFIAGLLIAILVSSAVSVGISTQLIKGQQGPEGPQGPQGEKGATGAQGPPGPQGPYLPDYDSGWVDIIDKAGKSITLTHNLNSTDVIVDVTGKMTEADSSHQFYLGSTGYSSGFETTYGGTLDDQGFSVVQTDDGGYAIAGWTDSFGAGDWDVYLVKTNAAGNVQWDKTYGGTAGDGGLSVVQTADGGYAIAGGTYSFGAGAEDVYLVKTDARGNMQWNKTYGGDNFDAGSSLIQTSDYGYAIAGYTVSFGAGNTDFYLVKTDADGTMQWSKTYGGTGSDVGHSVVQTADGGYAIAGFTGGDFYLVKTDAAGTMQWNETYGGTGDDKGDSVVQTSDGGYAIAGGAGDPGGIYLVKTDAAGTMQWNKTYGTSIVGYTGSVYSVIQTSDGGYALAGYTYSDHPGLNDVYLVKTDAAGTMQWNKTYGGTGDDYVRSLIRTVDGGYAIAGYTYSFGAGNADFYLVKTAVESGLAWISTPNTITLYRGATDIFWNYVRVRIWKID